MAADVGLQKLWLFEGKRKKYFVFVRYKVQDNFCLTTYRFNRRFDLCALIPRMLHALLIAKPCPLGRLTEQET
jgi:hypothetical protein